LIKVIKLGPNFESKNFLFEYNI